jgi:cytochrome c oxidase assembly factor CtaG
MRSLVERWRPWLSPVGVLLAVVMLVPPVGSAASQYVFVQAAQFSVFAFAVPALIVLGAPWRRARGRRLDRLAAGRSHRRSGWYPMLALVVFLALIVAWRLPACVNAMVRDPALTVAEAVSLIGAGCALWLELIESPPFLPRLGRPLRAFFAAVPMWTTWAGAYIMAFSHAAWFSAYAGRGHGLSVAADQQIAAVVLWVISALCAIPVVYVALITWLRDASYAEDELRRSPVVAAGLPRPPRGWRA